jgi:hypothetical protein
MFENKIIARFEKVRKNMIERMGMGLVKIKKAPFKGC